MDVESIIYNFKPNNKQITNDTYISRIRKLIENNIDVEDTQKVKQYISSFQYKTKRSYYIAIVVYLKAIGKDSTFYDNCVKEMGKKIEDDDKKNIASDKEKQNIVKREEIERILINLEDIIADLESKSKMVMKYFRTLQNYLIVNLYFLIPPIRNDYVAVDVYETLPFLTSNSKNYISLHEHTLILNRYKTDKKYGSITIKLPVKIIEIIRKLFQVRGSIFTELKGETALLLNANLKRMSKVNLIQNLNTIFRRKVSVTMLRKSYISEKYPVVHTIQDMETDASIMGHSVALQQSTYRKK